MNSSPELSSEKRLLNRIVPLPGEFVYVVKAEHMYIHVFAGYEKFTIFAEPISRPGQMVAAATYGHDADFVNCRWYWPNGKSHIVQLTLRHPLFEDCRKVAEDLWKIRDVMDG